MENSVFKIIQQISIPVILVSSAEVFNFVFSSKLVKLAVNVKKYCQKDCADKLTKP